MYSCINHIGIAIFTSHRAMLVCGSGEASSSSSSSGSSSSSSNRRSSSSGADNENEPRELMGIML